MLARRASVNLTEKQLKYAVDIVKLWSSKHTGCSLPFICAYVLWRSGETVTAKSAKKIASQVQNYLWDNTDGYHFFCDETKMYVFADHGRIDGEDENTNRVESYPWAGVSKIKGKWGPLSDEDIELFEECKKLNG